MVAEGALLSFSLGPVQPFIASARTVRDLWTGSYLLSWLTFAAMKPVLRELKEEAFILPSLEGNPLYRKLHRNEDVASAPLLTPCLPNRFLVAVPTVEQAESLALDCEKECRAAWTRVESAVRAALLKRVPDLDPLQLWDEQMRDLFEIRTVVLPRAEVTTEKCAGLLGETKSDWSMQFDLIGGLLDACRSTKHVPVYSVTAEKVPQKCTLLGTYEQLGPADLEKSRKFWEAFAEAADQEGTRTTSRERLCALSLVKRFAWPCYFAKELGQDVRELRYADSATVAATLWLTHARVQPDSIRKQNRDWSGQWLHWTTRTPEGEKACPEPVWVQIQQAKRSLKEKPSTYYAILMLDGDHMGRIMRSAGSPEHCRDFSQALTGFAIEEVSRIVEADYHGELIYAGGDDVLALLPTRNVLACAAALNKAYRDVWASLHPDATLSGGIVIAHYKEDLRFALNEVRRAEKDAKSAGRDALTLRVLRRSGEHTGALLGWDQLGEMESLIKQFANDFSDRWAYKLRGYISTLVADGETTQARFEAEIHRLLNRVEATGGDPKEVAAQTIGLLGNYLGWCKKRQLATGTSLEAFVTLVQSASFLARGREE